MKTLRHLALAIGLSILGVAAVASPVTYYVTGSLGTGLASFSDYDHALVNGWFSFDDATGQYLTTPAATRYSLTGFSINIVGQAATALNLDADEAVPGFQFNFGSYLYIGRTNGSVSLTIAENNDVPQTQSNEVVTFVLHWDLEQAGYGGGLISGYDDLMAGFPNWGSAFDYGTMSFLSPSFPHDVTANVSLIPAVPVPGALPLAAGAIGLLAAIGRRQRSKTIKR